jgi:hypothetical protein
VIETATEIETANEKEKEKGSVREETEKKEKRESVSVRESVRGSVKEKRSGEGMSDTVMTIERKDVIVTVIAIAMMIEEKDVKTAVKINLLTKMMMLLMIEDILTRVPAVQKNGIVRRVIALLAALKTMIIAEKKVREHIVNPFPSYFLVISIF